MSDSSNEQEAAGPTRSRKKVRRPEMWAQNISKKLRNTGQAYVSRGTKQQVVTRAVGEPCHDGCFMKVTRPVIDLLFKEFWDIGDFDLQTFYIQKLVQKAEVKRRQKLRDPASPGPLRSYSLQYTVVYQNTVYQVCRQGFLSVFGLSRRRVDTALKKASEASTPTTDLRGKHPQSRAITDHQKELVREHNV